MLLTVVRAFPILQDINLFTHLSERSMFLFMCSTIYRRNICLAATGIMQIIDNYQILLLQTIRNSSSDGHHIWVTLTHSSIKSATLWREHFLRRLPTSIMLVGTLYNTTGCLRYSCDLSVAAIRPVCVCRRPCAYGCRQPHRMHHWKCKWRTPNRIFNMEQYCS